MDGSISRINVSLASSLPANINRDMASQPNARELSLAAKNRSLASENSQLEGRNNQLRAENRSLKSEIQSLEQESQSQPRVPGYATDNSKGQWVDAFI
ncbi:MAG: hypothetical protein HQL47_11240 [Gammaproteobacteria bacterium]|nr:hypothetical protein [Gammaproteobacteria bacterium]